MHKNAKKLMSEIQKQLSEKISKDTPSKTN